MIIGASQDGLSFSEISELLMRSCLQSLQRMVRKQKISSEQQSCGQKCRVNERGQRTRARLTKADSNTNNHTLQQWYAEEHLKLCQTSKWKGYSSRRPIRWGDIAQEVRPVIWQSEGCRFNPTMGVLMCP